MQYSLKITEKSDCNSNKALVISSDETWKEVSKGWIGN